MSHSDDKTPRADGGHANHESESANTESLSDTSVRLESASKAQPHLFCVVDRGRPLAGGSRHSLANIRRIEIGRGRTRHAKRVFESGSPTLLLQVPDTRISTKHVCVDKGDEGWVLRDFESTNGVRVNGRRVLEATLGDGDVVELGRTLFLFQAAVVTPVNAPGDQDSSDLQGLSASFGTLSPTLVRELESLERLARSDVSILLEGEPGTGKEVLARAIHSASGRSGPFVAVNCAALPQGLVESLLFGHKKGAFSGAITDDLGFVRAAHGGTLLLDEAGDLPPGAQAALLRVLQEREVVPLGSPRPERVDVRFIAATHRSLAALSRSSIFREDLLARLAEFTWRLPPLRDRRADLGVLAATLLQRLAGAQASSLTLSRSAGAQLLAHDWPMNVRELEHALKVGVLLARGDRIDLNLQGEKASGEAPVSQAKSAAPLSVHDEALRRDLVAKFEEHQGNVTRVAAAMGTARRQVQRWILRFGIDPTRFRQ